MCKIASGPSLGYVDEVSHRLRIVIYGGADESAVCTVLFQEPERRTGWKAIVLRIVR